ncbi:hypothetical protein [Carboxylicivirga sp. M1479]|uniref:hypothetical protein n=1 Tax=Carboxylicivirga sp. M1479 TaxID=2594476 RepID=UPI001177B60E|nr:hypothetical protein [Carboxylicivirga sp. M1479]TRX71957.1 hypothetical protein FNN09_04870 [Carboxylicivirga sp. M1479]
MKNLNEIGLQELSCTEIKVFNGGEKWYVLLSQGFNAGTGQGDVSREDINHFGWYSIGYGLGVSAKAEVG